MEGPKGSWRVRGGHEGPLEGHGRLVSVIEGPFGTGKDYERLEYPGESKRFYVGQ